MSPATTTLSIARLANTSKWVDVGASVIVPIPTSSATVALLGLLNVTVNVSSCSATASLSTGTEIVPVSVLTGMVSVPLVVV